MKLKVIKIQNFNQIDLDFSKSESILIESVNSINTRSNGSGKSCLFEKQLSEIQDFLTSIDMDPAKKH